MIRQGFYNTRDSTPSHLHMSHFQKWLVDFKNEVYNYKITFKDIQVFPYSTPTKLLCTFVAFQNPKPNIFLVVPEEISTILLKVYYKKLVKFNPNVQGFV